MKKVLAILVTVTMLVTCIAPALFVSSAAGELEVSVSEVTFDPTARDDKLTATAIVSIDANPGFLEGVWYLYADSTELEITEVVDVTAQDGDDLLLVEGEPGDSPTSKIKRALEGAGVTVSDTTVVSAIEMETDSGDNFAYVGDVVKVTFTIAKDRAAIALGDVLTFGLVNGETVDVDDEELTFAPIVSGAKAVADPNAPVYEDKNFTDLTLFIDTVTVKDNVSTVEVGVGLAGTSDLFEQYGICGGQIVIAYPGEFVITGVREGNVLPDGATSLDYQAEGANLAETAPDVAKERFAVAGFDPTGTGYKYVNQIHANLSDMSPEATYGGSYETGYINYFTFDVSAAEIGEYEIYLCIKADDVVGGDLVNKTNPVLSLAAVSGAVKIIDSCAHANTHNEVVDATCTVNGSDSVVCDDCGKTISTTVLTAPGHAPKAVPGAEADCDDAGLTEGSVCSVCGEVLVAQNEIPALGHTRGQKVILSQPTFDLAGAWEIRCTVCNEVVESGEIPAIGAGFNIDYTSDYIDGKYYVYATVSNNPGIWSVKTSIDYNTDTLELVEVINGTVFTDAEYETSATSKVPFTYVGAYDQLQANNTNTGLLYTLVFAVKDCEGENGLSVTVAEGDVFNEALENVSCNITEDYITLQHVAKDGEPTCTEGVGCQACDAIVIPALGHTPGAEATCTTAQTCTVCGDVIVAALGHTPGAEATCTEPQTCTVCGEVLAEALGHTPEVVPAVDPTCTETGLTEGSKCSVCDEVLVAQETVPATGHTAGAVATCTEPQTCTVCGEVLAEALGHTPGAEATCTTAQTCTVCGDVIVEALGHTAGAAATCTEPQTCTVCGEVLAEALGHTPEVVPAVDPTCTETGLTEGSKCSVCDEVLVAQEVVEALGHTYVDLEAKDATCDESGYAAGVQCERCHLTEEGEDLTIEAKGHVAGEKVVVKEAEVGVAGAWEIKCEECSEVIESGEIPALEPAPETTPETDAETSKPGTNAPQTGDNMIFVIVIAVVAMVACAAVVIFRKRSAK